METRTSRRVSARHTPRTVVDQPDVNANNSVSSRATSAEEREGSSRNSKAASRQFTPLMAPIQGIKANQGNENEVLDLGVGTPLKTRGLDQLRQRIEEELGKQPQLLSANTSPGLARLRNTPGRGLREKQRELIEKHEHIRQHSDKLSVGGGVALWPNMNQMRLSYKEIITLIFICIGLAALTGWLFVLLHGETIKNMWRLTEQLQTFSNVHTIRSHGSPKELKASLLAWHADFRQLLDGTDRMLNVRRPSTGYQVYIVAYLVGFGVLVYFLIDNMLSKSKLSPGRIKKWVCLLVVIGQWTAMLFVMFVYAQRVETAVMSNVVQLSDKMGDLVERDVDLTTASVIIQYWRGRCLPPAAQGVVWVLGVVPVQDVSVYLQYYSLPVVTVLFTPVIRLCLALRSVYSSPRKDF